MMIDKDPNCAYCMEGDLVAKFGIKIRELAASKVYLFKEQSHLGRVIVASKFHVSEMVNLKPAQRRAFMDDVAAVAEALHRVFKPAKVNYGAYGDTGCHLHFHLVPKYRDDEFEWGGTFAMNPDRKYLTDAEYDELVAKISAALLIGNGDGLFEALQKLRSEIADDGRVDYNESSVLLEALKPFAADDQYIAKIVNELVKIREDGVVSPEESATIIALFDHIFA